jgi:general stress protein YciG
MDAAPIEVGSYSQLIELLRHRVEELGITLDTIDEVGGLAARYASKLLSNPPVKSMGAMSLFAVLGVLGLRLQLCSDSAAIERLSRREDWIAFRRKGARYRPRRGGVVRFQNDRDFYRQIGRKGARARALLQRRRRAQTLKARMARWGNGRGKHVD